jgi:hypothetical protein
MITWKYYVTELPDKVVNTSGGSVAYSDPSQQAVPDDLNHFDVTHDNKPNNYPTNADVPYLVSVFINVLIMLGKL